MRPARKPAPAESCGTPGGVEQPAYATACRIAALPRGFDQLSSSMPPNERPPRDLASAYRETAEAVARAIGSDVRRGLSDDDAGARLARYGPNELAAEPPVPAWSRFVAQFKDTLVILLLVATAVSVALWTYERDTALPYEAIAIFAVVLLNATMGFSRKRARKRRSARFAPCPG